MKQFFQENFTYQTAKIIRVIDRKLGLFYYSIASLIFAYIFIYVLLIKKTYLSKETTTGRSSVQAVGKFIGVDEDGNTKAFDIGDLVKDMGMTSTVFLATNVSVTEG